jgi:hypothetical protein
MMKKHLPLLLALLAAGPALAAPDQPTVNPRPNSGLMRYDANKDGVVDRSEWDAGQAARFRQLDTNNDGKLTMFPRRGDDRAAQRQESQFNFMDRNRDGVVSKDEFTAQADRNFARCDSDKNGRIDTAECRQALRRQPVDRASTNQQR